MILPPEISSRSSDPRCCETRRCPRSPHWSVSLLADRTDTASWQVAAPTPTPPLRNDYRPGSSSSQASAEPLASAPPSSASLSLCLTVSPSPPFPSLSPVLLRCHVLRLPLCQIAELRGDAVKVMSSALWLLDEQDWNGQIR